MDFCLNSKSTQHFITKMNNSKIPWMYTTDISSDTWREKGHTVKSYKKQDNSSQNHSVILMKDAKLS